VTNPEKIQFDPNNDGLQCSLIAITSRRIKNLRHAKVLIGDRLYTLANGLRDCCCSNEPYLLSLYFNPRIKSIQSKTMRIALSLSLLLIGLTTCQKNPLWVGNKEFFTVSYTNSTSPRVSSSPINESPFIEVGKISATNTGAGAVQIKAEGVRIQSKYNNFEIDTVLIYEKDKNRFKIQDEFNSISSSKKTDIAAVLVLDMSTSLSSLVNNLKEYAKSFVDKVVSSTPNSKVAIVFFSGKDDITSTAFYDNTNASVLKTLIDEFDNYQKRTALFKATSTGIEMLDKLNFTGSKALVVFTDGGDNDSNNPETLKSNIAQSEYLRISIGLKGDDFDKDDIESIASTKQYSIVAKKQEDLEGIFETVARQIISVYTIIYERSDQILPETIEIKFECQTTKIK